VPIELLISLQVNAKEAANAAESRNTTICSIISVGNLVSADDCAEGRAFSSSAFSSLLFCPPFPAIHVRRQSAVRPVLYLPLLPSDTFLPCFRPRLALLKTCFLRQSVPTVYLPCLSFRLETRCTLGFSTTV